MPHTSCTPWDLQEYADHPHGIRSPWIRPSCSLCHTLDAYGHHHRQGTHEDPRLLERARPPCNHGCLRGLPPHSLRLESEGPERRREPRSTQSLLSTSTQGPESKG